jgi:Flp pilus assembly pilin Flp
MERWRNSVTIELIGLARDRRAQDMIEYALLAGFIAVAVAAWIPYSTIPALSHIYSRLNTVCSNLMPTS